MSDRQTYRVRAVPDGRWYAVTIDGLPPHLVGVTQSPVEEGEPGVESMTREVVALLLGVDEKSFDLAVTVAE